MEAILKLVGISKQFPGVKALDNVDFSLWPGEVHGLMGENGAGKSTLINVISGLLQPSSGKIYLAGRELSFGKSSDAQKAGISTISQEFSLVPGLTVAENIFLGREPTGRGGLINWHEIRKRAVEILTELGFKVAVNQRVEYLSVGDRQLVEIAKALSLDFRIIMMDEPTAALSATEAARLFKIVQKLKLRNIAVLYVSHRLGEVFRIADRVTVLRDGKTAGTRSLAELTEDDVVTMMLGRALKREAAVEIAHAPVEKPALALDQLTVRGILSNISFSLRFGEVVGCAGLVGSGRYELTQALFGLLPISDGQIEVNGKPASLGSPVAAIHRGIYMLPEDRKVEGIFPDLSVLENVVISARDKDPSPSQFLIKPSNERKQYESQRSSLDIRATSPAQGITKLSGGNQQKVMIGRALVSNSRVLLLNEPTRGVDIKTKLEIHSVIRGLARQGYAVMVSSSDFPELVSVSDRCLVLSAGRIAGLLSKQQISEDNITALAIGSGLSEKSE
jgi:ribose transport system ATP-binding protein